MAQIPQHAWLNGNPFYYELYQTHNAKDRLRRKVATAFHDALPDAVAECLVDELLNAELYGHQRQFLIKSQVDPAISVILDAVRKLAVPYQAANGETCLMIPIERLDSIQP